ncbi:hypothetical protein Tco_1362288 [Tanacetum coccineum]
MVRLWWPQPARPPPQRWRQAAEHREAPRGVTPPQPDTTWCGCGGCTVAGDGNGRRGEGDGYGMGCAWQHGDRSRGGSGGDGGCIEVNESKRWRGNRWESHVRFIAEINDGKVFRSPEHMAGA